MCGPMTSDALYRGPDLAKHFGNVVCRNDVGYDSGTGIVTYRTFFHLDDGRVISAHSQIAFPSQTEIAELIAMPGWLSIAGSAIASAANLHRTAPKSFPWVRKHWVEFCSSGQFDFIYPIVVVPRFSGAVAVCF